MGSHVTTTVAWLCSSLCMSAGASAQTFVLHDATTIEGTITGSTNNTISVIDENGAIVPLSLADIQEIRLPIEGQEQELAAQLVSWRNGVYELLTKQYVFWVKDGRIVSSYSRPLETDPAAFKETSPQATQGSRKATTPEDLLPSRTSSKKPTM